MEAEGAIPNPSNTRIAVVTGGNKGIGLEVCRQLASAGITVVLTARDKTRGTAAMEKLREAGLSNVIFHQLEITDAPSIAWLADFLKPCFGKLDVLINNAAILGVEYLLDPSLTSKEKCSEMDMRQRLEWLSNGVQETYDTARECLQTNYYGTKHVIEALLPLLQASSDGRIVNVSSEWGLRLIDNEELRQELNDVEKLTEARLDTFLRGWPEHFSAYKVSNVTMNACSRILARRHPELRINCAHPGYVNTDMSIHSGPLTPEEGAANLVKVALLPEGGPTGAFFTLGQEALFV